MCWDLGTGRCYRVSVSFHQYWVNDSKLLASYFKKGYDVHLTSFNKSILVNLHPRKLRKTKHNYFKDMDVLENNKCIRGNWVVI